MSSSEQTVIAIIADAHCHDMDSDYGLKSHPLAGHAATLRSWQDTRSSSRVFNESASALCAALDDIQRRGIRHVVLLGDYTDDGQIEATARVRARLLDYRDRVGMAFYAIPGNHDAFGPHGKHQSTRFVSVPGETVLVTSDPEFAASEDNAVLSPAMYRQGTPAALHSMAEFGLCPQPGYLHWETPFGTCPAIEARQYMAHSADGHVERSLTDASYLVEPVAGLWLLMIDANVFEPRNGQWRDTQKKAFLDSSDAGWNSVLRNRAHLLPWIQDVCARARSLNKQLIGFSHYPVMDPFDDHSDSEQRLFGQTDMRRRRPSEQIARLLAEAGLELHFGGHLHVNAYRQYRQDEHRLTDIAVPSTATFPAAYQLVHATATQLQLETVPLNDMPLDQTLMDYYRAEVHATDALEDRALQARNYGEFLYQRMYCRIVDHWLPRQWPAAIAQAMRTSHAAELATFLLAQRLSAEPLYYGQLPTVIRLKATAELHELCKQAGMTIPGLESCTLQQVLINWYCLRQAGYQACHFFEPAHLPVLDFLTRQFADLRPVKADTQAGYLNVFLGVLQQSLQRSIPGSGLERSLDTSRLL